MIFLTSFKTKIFEKLNIFNIFHIKKITFICNILFLIAKFVLSFSKKYFKNKLKQLKYVLNKKTMNPYFSYVLLLDCDSLFIYKNLNFKINIKTNLRQILGHIFFSKKEKIMLKKSCQRIQKVARNEVYKHNFSTSEIYMYIFFLQKRHKQEREKKTSIVHIHFVFYWEQLEA